jgi:hypothetical protein
MVDERQEPTERTPKGFEVPVPKRGDFFANLKKVGETDKADAPKRDQPPAAAGS